jgi:hypothetical protein
MRWLDKGNHPLDEQAQPVVLNNYQDAAPYLKTRLGRYCSYCERFTASSLAVEHKLPKKHHDELERDWLNLLLACVNCNSIKGSKVALAHETLWPDEHNTFAALEYLPSGSLRVREGLAADLAARAQRLLSLTGLDAGPMASLSDHRWFDRLEAWRKAETSVHDLAANDSPQLRRQIVETALSTGGFSIWMAAFANDAAMQQALHQAFPGTHPNLLN